MTIAHPVNPVIVISTGDNVATALESLEPGRVLVRVAADRVAADRGAADRGAADRGAADRVAADREPADVTVRDAIPRGHKVAIARIAPGAAVVKYGSSIGVATEEIQPGSHVHTHNVASARGRGDLAAARQQPAAAGRLAEPDEFSGSPRDPQRRDA